jgi:protein TonB
MPSYRGTADRPDQAKAIAAVIAVHALLALIIVAGLNVRTVSQAVESLKTFNIAPPPPPPPPKPAPRPHEAKKPAGAPAPKAEPRPVVAPPPRIQLPFPVPAAKVAGTGTASTSGAGASGTGTGAGGAGNGAGGGGDYSRFTPARLVRNLTRGDYRSIAAGRLPSGRAMVSLRVEPSGVPSDCRVIRSSGDPVVDSGLCPLIEARLRFRPALDAQGRPIAYQLQYVATWRL